MRNVIIWKFSPTIKKDFYEEIWRLNGRNMTGITQLTFLVSQDFFKTSLQYVFQKRLQDVLNSSWRHLCKASSRRSQDVFKTCLRDVFFKTSSRRLQEDVLQLCIKDVFKTSWRCHGRQKMLHWRRLQDFFKTSSVRLQNIFTKTNVCWEFV